MDAIRYMLLARKSFISGVIFHNLIHIIKLFIRYYTRVVVRDFYPFRGIVFNLGIWIFVMVVSICPLVEWVGEYGKDAYR